MSEELSYTDVATHSSKKDLFIVVHDKIYNASSFVDEHPGGEEVLLDVGGQDATEAFEDVGHSDEAREILEGMLVGNLKRGPNDPPSKTASTDKIAAGPGGGEKGSYGAMGGVGLYAVVLIGVAVAYGAYSYLQSSDKK